MSCGTKIWGLHSAFYDNNREEFRHSFYFEYQLLWHQQQDDLTFNDVFYYFEGHV